MTQWATGYGTAYFKMKDLKFIDRVSCEADLLFAFTHFTQTDRHSESHVYAGYKCTLHKISQLDSIKSARFVKLNVY